jgi:hypothetical protein
MCASGGLILKNFLDVEIRSEKPDPLKERKFLNGLSAADYSNAEGNSGHGDANCYKFNREYMVGRVF